MSPTRANEILADRNVLNERIRTTVERLPIEVPDERIGAITDRVEKFYGEVSGALENYLTEQLGELPDLEGAAEGPAEPTQAPRGLDGIMAGVGKAGVLVLQGATAVATNAFTVVLHFLIMVVVLFSLFLRGSELKQFLMDLSPLPDDEEEALVSRFSDMSRAVFIGNGTASLLQGICGGIGFELFDLGPGVLWGAVITFLAFLPIVGAMVVFMPVGLYLLVTGEVGLGVLYLAYNLTYVAVLEYGLKPRLIGGRVRMDPVLVFLGILSGLAMFWRARDLLRTADPGGISDPDGHLPGPLSGRSAFSGHGAGGSPRRCARARSRSGDSSASRSWRRGVGFRRPTCSSRPGWVTSSVSSSSGALRSASVSCAAVTANP